MHTRGTHEPTPPPLQLCSLLLLCLRLCLCLQQTGAKHFRALVPPSDVPALVAQIAGERDPTSRPPLYNLAVSSGASAERFERQRQAIEDELQHKRYAASLQAMPYHLRTVASKGYCPAGIATRLAVSTLPRSGSALASRASQKAAEAVLMGVFPHRAQPAVASTLTPRGGEAARKARSVERTEPPTPGPLWRTSRLALTSVLCVCLLLW